MEAALSTATATHGAALRLILSENILTEASKSPAGLRIYVISINSVHCSVCCWARGNVSQNAGWVETEDDRN